MTNDLSYGLVTFLASSSLGMVKEPFSEVGAPMMQAWLSQWYNDYNDDSYQRGPTVQPL
jgi:hypothetical protein